MSLCGPQRLECAICLDNCLNAVRLDCNHIFCYLCVKGSAQQSNNRCPVCRRHISNDYLENPNLIETIDWKSVPTTEGMQWQYEGRNGWWLYDSRTNRDIEKSFAANESTLEVLIAGFVYIIDFQRMIQFRRNQPNRIRKIRRHSVDPNLTKGVSGLRANFHDIQNISEDSNESQCTPNELNSEETLQNETISNDDNSVSNEVNEESVDQNSDQNSVDVNQLQQMFDRSLNIRETYL